MKRLRLQDLSDLIDVGKLSNLTRYCYKCKKILYSNEEEARAVGSRMASKGLGKTRPYSCPKCDGWHLTSLIKSVRPK
jgi:hypothetical protein